MKFTSPEGWSIDSANWAVNTLIRMYDRGEIDFDAKVQRDFIWSKNKSSKYIQSLLWGMLIYNIPHLYSKHENIYYSIDGQQRALSLIKFCKNEYRLVGIEDFPINVNGELYNINRKYFKNLPPRLQEMILDYQINVAVLEDASEKVEAEFFTRANSGVAVSRKDTSFANSVSKDEILSIAQHELFKVMFSNSNLSPRKEVVVKTYISINETVPDYSQKHYNTVITNSEFSEDTIKEINSVYDRILGAYKIILIQNEEIAKRLVEKTHMLSYIPHIDKFENSNQLANWFVKFWNNRSEEYIKSSNDHTTNLSNIRNRDRIINESINEFLSYNQ